MIIKRTQYIICCIIFFILNVKAAGVNTTDRQMLVDSVSQLSLDEKISLILLPVDKKLYLDQHSRGQIPPNVMVADNWLLDGIHGFQTGDLMVPFPDARAISCVNDDRLLGILREDLLFYAAKNKNRAILASQRYLFQESNSNFLFTPERKRDLTLWIFTGDNDGAEGFPVYNMPANLFSERESLKEIHLNGKFDNLIRFWADGEEKVNSFEEVLHDGGFFLTKDFAKDHARLVRAYQNKMFPEEDLDKWCQEILNALKRSGYRPLPVRGVPSGLATYARRMAFEQSLHLFKYQTAPFIPSNLSSVNIRVISDVSSEMTAAFEEMMYNHLPLARDKKNVDFVFWLTDGRILSDSVIISRLSDIKGNFPEAKVALLLADPGNYFKNHLIPLSVDAVFTGSSDWPLVWEYLAQAAFSGVEIQKIQKQESWLSGIQYLSIHVPQTRLKFGIPEEVAMCRDSLEKIDKLMAEAVKEKATPGGQVLVARDGVVVWNKSYGYHTYAEERKVQNSDIYDLASVTKILATVPSLMKLYGQGRWSLSDSLGQFFPETDTTDKSGITMKDLLLHESGLPAFIPFYLNTVDMDQLQGELFGRRYSGVYSIKLDDHVYLNRTVKYRTDVFNTEKSGVFSVPVAQNIYMNVHYLDSIMTQVVEAPMRTRHKYLYSDLGFYFLGKVVARLSGQTLDAFATDSLYLPMGMTNTTFLPSLVFQKDKIVPTEDDEAFRKQLLHGWVHDPGAAMMGGVAGHAGLFANATDLGKFMQMYLNGGTYGGERYFDEGIVEQYTQTCNEENRRGLGFDKPEPDTTKVSPVSRYASPASFGHSGFTGTLVWVDPKTEIVYIFLSNRIHPHQYNKKLIEKNFRTRIQDIIYRSIIEPAQVKSPDHSAESIMMKN